MARILRCPACGALWRVDLDDDSAQLRCGECGTVFASAKAETLEVDDEALDDALARRAAAVAAAAAAETNAQTEQDADASLKAEPTLSGDPLSTDAPSTEDSDDVEAQTQPQPRRNPLWGLLGSAAVLALLAGGALMTADAIVREVPALRPAFQAVCGQLPCPGLAWQDAKAWTLTGEIVPTAVDAATEATAEGSAGANTSADAHTAPSASAQPVQSVQVRIRFENASERTLLLPLVEVKLLDAAGTPIAERLVEPADLGFATVDGNAPRLAPQGRTEALLTITTPLPIAPVSVALKAWDPQLR